MHREMSLKGQHSLDITVHHFCKTSLITGTSQSRVLEQGRNIVRQATEKNGEWHTRGILGCPATNTRHSQFLYSPSPPHIEGKRSMKLKEWGSPPDESEIFRTNCLPDFESTYFALAAERKLSSVVSPRHEGDRPRKKRRLDQRALNQLIPQPHLLPSQFRTSSRQVDVAAYRKSKPIMISPYTLPLDNFDEWSRCTWVIPIRGKLPWLESTTGVLLDSFEDLPEPPNAQTNELIWTSTAVSKFWEFLVGLRLAGNLGPLGISFHPGLSPPMEKSIRISSTIPTNAVETSVSGISSTFASNSISSVDHIKIYHEWSRSLQIRSILHAWPFESGGHKIRLLVGAKLVLLDQKSRGVMIL